MLYKNKIRIRSFYRDKSYLILILFFLISPNSLFSFTLTPQTIPPQAGGVVSVASDYLPAEQLFIFRTDTGVWTANTADTNITLTDVDLDGSTDLWIVPVMSDSDGWGGCSYTFDECVVDEAHYVSSVGYQRLYVVPEPTSNSSQSEEPQNSSVFRPDITITAPFFGSVFSKTVPVEYQSSGEIVSLFYSDKVSNWDGSIVNPNLKKFIADNLPGSGRYDWSFKNLLEGVFYRIIGDSFNSRGDFGQAVSELFTIDLSSPTFKTRTEPPAAKSGDVKIIIDSSEDLSLVPVVSVTQKNGKPISVTLTGDKNHYEGIYTVRPGYDGTAQISVSGTDKSGNAGNTVVSGGTFSVGFNPPPKARITEPLPNSVTINDSVTVKGSIREDATAILKVNGVEISTVKPDSSGTFVFSKVPLEKTKNQGKNTISIEARDPLGAVGEPATVDVKRNTPPIVSITAPSKSELVHDSVDILVSTEDENKDPLVFTYQIQPLRGTLSGFKNTDGWYVIGDALPGSGFTWNATEVDDGEYRLRVIADDGFEKTTSAETSISIRNTLPFIRFEDGRQTVTRFGNATIVGRVMTSKNLPVRPSINEINYSTDGGKNWKLVNADGTGYSEERKFSLTLSNLKDGTYPILFQIKDSRGLIGRASHIVIIDRTPPAKPRISSPLDGATVTADSDEDKNIHGIQTTVLGTSESRGSVSLQYSGGIIKGRVSPDGKFLFPKLTLSKRGVYSMSVSATDEAGNKSASSTISVVYDNPPVITFTHPKASRGLSGKTYVSWNIRDEDGDVIQNTSVMYRKGSGVWKTIATNVTAVGKVDFDVSDLSEGGDYELRIDTSDGLVKSTLSEGFSVDRTIPTISPLEKINSELLSKGILTNGTARDSISGIEYVEYTIEPKTVESAENSVWYTALITSGYLSRNASYTIAYPKSLIDGEYLLFVRSVDSAGNTSEISQEYIYIDKTAPRIGSFQIESNGIFVPPNESGILSVLQNKDSVFSVSLENDALGALVSIGSTTLPLVKNSASGLWTTNIKFLDRLPVSIVIKAEDLVGNKTASTTIGSVKTIESGYITSSNNNPVEGVKIGVLKLNEGTNEFIPYVSLNGSQGDVLSNTDGSYELALPQGSYELFVTKTGFNTESKKITLIYPGFVNESFVLKEAVGFWGWLQSVIDKFKY